MQPVAQRRIVKIRLPAVFAIASQDGVASSPGVCSGRSDRCGSLSGSASATAHSPGIVKIDVFDVAVISAAEFQTDRAGQRHPSNSGGALARHLQRQPATDREPQNGHAGQVKPIEKVEPDIGDIVDTVQMVRQRRLPETRHARDHDFKLLCQIVEQRQIEFEAVFAVQQQQ